MGIEVYSLRNPARGASIEVLPNVTVQLGRNLPTPTGVETSPALFTEIRTLDHSSVLKEILQNVSDPNGTAVQVDAMGGISVASTLPNESYWRGLLDASKISPQPINIAIFAPFQDIDSSATVVSYRSALGSFSNSLKSALGITREDEKRIQALFGVATEQLAMPLEYQALIPFISLKDSQKSSSTVESLPQILYQFPLLSTDAPDSIKSFITDVQTRGINLLKDTLKEFFDYKLSNEIKVALRQGSIPKISFYVPNQLVSELSGTKAEWAGNLASRVEVLPLESIPRDPNNNNASINLDGFYLLAPQIVLMPMNSPIGSRKTTLAKSQAPLRLRVLHRLLTGKPLSWFKERNLDIRNGGIYAVEADPGAGKTTTQSIASAIEILYKIFPVESALAAAVLYELGRRVRQANNPTIKEKYQKLINSIYNIHFKNLDLTELTEIKTLIDEILGNNKFQETQLRAFLSAFEQSLTMANTAGGSEKERWINKSRYVVATLAAVLPFVAETFKELGVNYSNIGPQAIYEKFIRDVLSTHLYSYVYKSLPTFESIKENGNYDIFLPNIKPPKIHKAQSGDEDTIEFSINYFKIGSEKITQPLFDDNLLTEDNLRSLMRSHFAGISKTTLTRPRNATAILYERTLSVLSNYGLKPVVEEYKSTQHKIKGIFPSIAASTADSAILRLLLNFGNARLAPQPSRTINPLIATVPSERNRWKQERIQETEDSIINYHSHMLSRHVLFFADKQSPPRSDDEIESHVDMIEVFKDYVLRVYDLGFRIDRIEAESFQKDDPEVVARFAQNIFEDIDQIIESYENELKQILQNATDIADDQVSRFVSGIIKGGLLPDETDNLNVHLAKIREAQHTLMSHLTHRLALLHYVLTTVNLSDNPNGMQNLSQVLRTNLGAVPDLSFVPLSEDRFRSVGRAIAHYLGAKVKDTSNDNVIEYDFLLSRINEKRKKVITDWTSGKQLKDNDKIRKTIELGDYDLESFAAPFALNMVGMLSMLTEITARQILRLHQDRTLFSSGVGAIVNKLTFVDILKNQLESYFQAEIGLGANVSPVVSIVDMYKKIVENRLAPYNRTSNNAFVENKTLPPHQDLLFERDGLGDGIHNLVSLLLGIVGYASSYYIAKTNPILGGVSIPLLILTEGFAERARASSAWRRDIHIVPPHTDPSSPSSITEVVQYNGIKNIALGNFAYIGEDENTKLLSNYLSLRAKARQIGNNLYSNIESADAGISGEAETVDSLSLNLMFVNALFNIGIGLEGNDIVLVDPLPLLARTNPQEIEQLSDMHNEKISQLFTSSGQLATVQHQAYLERFGVYYNLMRLHRAKIKKQQQQVEQEYFVLKSVHPFGYTSTGILLGYEYADESTRLLQVREQQSNQSSEQASEQSFDPLAGYGDDDVYKQTIFPVDAETSETRNTFADGVPFQKDEKIKKIRERHERTRIFLVSPPLWKKQKLGFIKHFVLKVIELSENALAKQLRNQVIHIHFPTILIASAPTEDHPFGIHRELAHKSKTNASHNLLTSIMFMANLNMIPNKVDEGQDLGWLYFHALNLAWRQFESQRLLGSEADNKLPPQVPNRSIENIRTQPFATIGDIAQAVYARFTGVSLYSRNQDMETDVLPGLRNTNRALQGVNTLNTKSIPINEIHSLDSVHRDILRQKIRVDGELYRKGEHAFTHLFTGKAYLPTSAEIIVTENENYQPPQESFVQTITIKKPKARSKANEAVFIRIEQSTKDNNTTQTDPVSEIRVTGSPSKIYQEVFQAIARKIVEIQNKAQDESKVNKPTYVIFSLPRGLSIAESDEIMRAIGTFMAITTAINSEMSRSSIRFVFKGKGAKEEITRASAVLTGEFARMVETESKDEKLAFYGIYLPNLLTGGINKQTGVPKLVLATSMGRPFFEAVHSVEATAERDRTKHGITYDLLAQAGSHEEDVPAMIITYLNYDEWRLQATIAHYLGLLAAIDTRNPQSSPLSLDKILQLAARLRVVNAEQTKGDEAPVVVTFTANDVNARIKNSQFVANTRHTNTHIALNITFRYPESATGLTHIDDTILTPQAVFKELVNQPTGTPKVNSTFSSIFTISDTPPLLYGEKGLFTALQTYINRLAQEYIDSIEKQTPGGLSLDDSVELFKLAQRVTYTALSPNVPSVDRKALERERATAHATKDISPVYTAIAQLGAKTLESNWTITTELENLPPISIDNMGQLTIESQVIPIVPTDHTITISGNQFTGTAYLLTDAFFRHGPIRKYVVFSEDEIKSFPLWKENGQRKRVLNPFLFRSFFSRREETMRTGERRTVYEPKLDIEGTEYNFVLTDSEIQSLRKKIEDKLEEMKSNLEEIAKLHKDTDEQTVRTIKEKIELPEYAGGLENEGFIERNIRRLLVWTVILNKIDPSVFAGNLNNTTTNQKKTQEIVDAVLDVIAPDRIRYLPEGWQQRFFSEEAADEEERVLGIKVNEITFSKTETLVDSIKARTRLTGNERNFADTISIEDYLQVLAGEHSPYIEHVEEYVNMKGGLRELRKKGNLTNVIQYSATPVHGSAAIELDTRFLDVLVEKENKGSQNVQTTPDNPHFVFAFGSPIHALAVLPHTKEYLEHIYQFHMQVDPNTPIGNLFSLIRENSHLQIAKSLAPASFMPIAASPNVGIPIQIVLAHLALHLYRLQGINIDTNTLHKIALEIQLLTQYSFEIQAGDIVDWDPAQKSIIPKTTWLKEAAEKASQVYKSITGDTTAPLLDFIKDEDQRKETENNAFLKSLPNYIKDLVGVLNYYDVVGSLLISVPKPTIVSRLPLVTKTSMTPAFARPTLEGWNRVGTLGQDAGHTGDHDGDHIYVADTKEIDEKQQDKRILYKIREESVKLAKEIDELLLFHNPAEVGDQSKFNFFALPDLDSASSVTILFAFSRAIRINTASQQTTALHNVDISNEVIYDVSQNKYILDGTIQEDATIDGMLLQTSGIVFPQYANENIPSQRVKQIRIADPVPNSLTEKLISKIYIKRTNANQSLPIDQNNYLLSFNPNSRDQSPIDWLDYLSAIVQVRVDNQNYYTTIGHMWLFHMLTAHVSDSERKDLANDFIAENLFAHQPDKIAKVDRKVLAKILDYTNQQKQAQSSRLKNHLRSFHRVVAQHYNIPRNPSRDTNDPEAYIKTGNVFFASHNSTIAQTVKTKLEQGQTAQKIYEILEETTAAIAAHYAQLLAYSLAAFIYQDSDASMTVFNGLNRLENITDNKTRSRIKTQTLAKVVEIFRERTKVLKSFIDLLTNNLSLQSGREQEQLESLIAQIVDEIGNPYENKTLKLIARLLKYVVKVDNKIKIFLPLGNILSDPTQSTQGGTTTYKLYGVFIDIEQLTTLHSKFKTDFLDTILVKRAEANNKLGGGVKAPIYQNLRATDNVVINEMVKMIISEQPDQSVITPVTLTITQTAQGQLQSSWSYPQNPLRYVSEKEIHTFLNIPDELVLDEVEKTGSIKPVLLYSAMAPFSTATALQYQADTRMTSVLAVDTPQVASPEIITEDEMLFIEPTYVALKNWNDVEWSSIAIKKRFQNVKKKYSPVKDKIEYYKPKAAQGEFRLFTIRRKELLETQNGLLTGVFTLPIVEYSSFSKTVDIQELETYLAPFLQNAVKYEKTRNYMSYGEQYASDLQLIVGKESNTFSSQPDVVVQDIQDCDNQGTNVRNTDRAHRFTIPSVKGETLVSYQQSVDKISMFRETLSRIFFNFINNRIVGTNSNNPELVIEIRDQADANKKVTIILNISGLVTNTQSNNSQMFYLHSTNIPQIIDTIMQNIANAFSNPQNNLNQDNYYSVSLTIHARTPFNCRLLNRGKYEQPVCQSCAPLRMDGTQYRVGEKLDLNKNSIQLLIDSRKTPEGNKDGRHPLDDEYIQYRVKSEDHLERSRKGNSDLNPRYNSKMERPFGLIHPTPSSLQISIQETKYMTAKNGSETFNDILYETSTITDAEGTIEITSKRKRVVPYSNWLAREAKNIKIKGTTESSIDIETQIIRNLTNESINTFMQERPLLFIDKGAIEFIRDLITTINNMSNKEIAKFINEQHGLIETDMESVRETQAGNIKKAYIRTFLFSTFLFDTFTQKRGDVNIVVEDKDTADALIELMSDYKEYFVFDVPPNSGETDDNQTQSASTDRIFFIFYPDETRIEEFKQKMNRTIRGIEGSGTTRRKREAERIKQLLSINPAKTVAILASDFQLISPLPSPIIREWTASLAIARNQQYYPIELPRIDKTTGITYEEKQEAIKKGFLATLKKLKSEVDIEIAEKLSGGGTYFLGPIYKEILTLNIVAGKHEKTWSLRGLPEYYIALLEIFERSRQLTIPAQFTIQNTSGTPQAYAAQVILSHADTVFPVTIRTPEGMRMKTIADKRQLIDELKKLFEDGMDVYQISTLGYTIASEASRVKGTREETFMPVPLLP